MVKNTGGCKQKKQGRKFINVKQTSILRVSNDELEVYAQVDKNLGNGMCHVVCEKDGKTRLCHIRGKFRGRGKRDNTISTGSWVLVGLRDYETERDNSEKLENCDLLEVYDDMDKIRLKSTVTNVNWSLFISNDNKQSNISSEYSEIEFTNNNASLEYQELIEKTVASSGTESKIYVDDEEVNVDDI